MKKIILGDFGLRMIGMLTTFKAVDMVNHDELKIVGYVLFGVGMLIYGEGHHKMLMNNNCKRYGGNKDV